MSDTKGLPIVWEWCQFHNWKHETIPCPTCRAEKAERELAAKNERVRVLEGVLRGILGILFEFEEIDGAEKEIIAARTALGEEAGE